MIINNNNNKKKKNNNNMPCSVFPSGTTEAVEVFKTDGAGSIDSRISSSLVR